MCCEPVTRIEDKSQIDGECPECGSPTVEGLAAYGCYYSPIACDTCKWQPCDGSC